MNNRTLAISGGVALAGAVAFGLATNNVKEVKSPVEQPKNEVEKPVFPNIETGTIASVVITKCQNLLDQRGTNPAIHLGGEHDEMFHIYEGASEVQRLWIVKEDDPKNSESCGLDQAKWDDGHEKRVYDYTTTNFRPSPPIKGLNFPFQRSTVVVKRDADGTWHFEEATKNEKEEKAKGRSIVSDSNGCLLQNNLQGGGSEGKKSNDCLQVLASQKKRFTDLFDATKVVFSQSEVDAGVNE